MCFKDRQEKGEGREETTIDITDEGLSIRDFLGTLFKCQSI